MGESVLAKGSEMPLMSLESTESQELPPQPLVGRRRSSQIRAEQMQKMREALTRDEDEVTHQISPAFTKFMACVIILSAARLGMQCQWSEREYPALAQAYFVADVIFLALFTFEIVIKLFVQRCEFFWSMWNFLDVVITVAGMVDMWEQITPGSTVCSGPRIMFTLRFLRVIRLIRVLKGIDEFVMVVEGMVKAMSSVAWVFLLLLIVVYMFGVFITMELGRDEEMSRELGDINYFGDLQHSMLTLLDIALLAEWPELIRPIMHHRPMLLPLFMLFMTVSTFGVMNIIIGVICDGTSAARSEMETRQKKSSLAHASELWEETLHKQGLGRSDLQKAGEADKAELLQRRKDAIFQIVQVVMDSGYIDFPHGLSAKDVVNLLDFDGNCDLSHDEFLSGLSRLLLGNEFQLTCLMLTMMGKLRNESKTHIQGLQKSLELNTGRLEERLKKIEDKIIIKA